MKITNSYSNLPTNFYSKQKPDFISNPELIFFNQKLAKEIGFNSNEDLAQIFSGNKLLKNSQPISQAYAGHQFGHLVPSLGDGRAILLGEIANKKNQIFDIVLKGSGRTVYSRNGDGKYPIGPAIREYLVSEAMHYLKIPTSRSLALIKTNEDVLREESLPGAILTRIASSHIRIGTFEYFAILGDLQNIKILADYSIKRHYPECLKDKNPYLSFLKKVINKQANLVASWMSVGFVHGVMNSDNTLICGQTIDFGPCAFLDEYEKDKVFSSIDRYGRYGFNNQKNIMPWNLARLAEAILPLIDSDLKKAIKLAEIEINKFFKIFDKFYYQKMLQKIGILNFSEKDYKLIDDFLEILEKKKLDFTNSFRNLPHEIIDDNWHQRWQKRIKQQNLSVEEIFNKMNKINPAAIPRNHLIAKAIAKAVNDDDFTYAEEFLKVLQKPFVRIENREEFYQQAKEDEKVRQTFCGT